jgi:uncharacterized protein YbjT (DUF2867 family)
VHDVFVTGGTGFMGRRLVEALLERGHHVRVLARAGSEKRLPPGIEIVVGNALDASTFSAAVSPADTFVHLVGTPHPNPAKARQFEEIDLTSIRAAVSAATAAGVRHFVYVSVAQPAPVMRAYIAVRQRGEQLIRESGMNSTMLRPWYVLAPGRWWPRLFIPVYAVLRRIPSTAESAKRLGLVTHHQMLATLITAVEHPPAGIRIIEVPEIAAARVSAAPAIPRSPAG